MQHQSWRGAALRGLAAGAAATVVEGLFRIATSPIAPRPQPIYDWPEGEQVGEKPAETVARRILERGLRAGPLSPRQKGVAGVAVRLGVGSLLGGAYGVARAMGRADGGVADGAALWALGDNAILPLADFAGAPWRYSARYQGYQLASRMVYGAALAAVYDSMEPRPGLVAGIAATAMATLGGARVARSLLGRPAAATRRLADQGRRLSRALRHPLAHA